MKDFLVLSATLVACTAWGMWVVHSQNPHLKQVRDIVAECQSTLPRNQACEVVVTAVPAKVKEDIQ